MAPGSATHAEPLCHRGVLRVGHPTGRVQDSATHAVPPWARRLKALKPVSSQRRPYRVPTIGVSASVEAEDVPEGERKLVTALFADIKGSTELMQNLDPEELVAVIDPALKIMIDAVHRYDGYVVQSTGDGIFALFGAPVAHEDHPQRAVLTALRMQQEIKRLRAGCAPRAAPHSRSGSDSTPERWWCGRSQTGASSRVHADRPYREPRLAHANAGPTRARW